MRRPSITLLLASLLLAGVSTARADEGMFLFTDPPRKLLKKRYKITLDDAWLARIRRASVRFGWGGSGAFVSPHGLLLTNHHVGRGCIKRLSSPEHDYVKDGFYAVKRADEQRCPGTEASILEAIEDVTDKVRGAPGGATDPAEVARLTRAEMERLQKACGEEPGTRCDVIELAGGARYQRYRYKRYDDVRLVFAPETQFAFFGGDRANFNYPRYNLDIAFFRVYGAEGRPIATPEYLPFFAPGVKQGDLVFVVGNPHRTQRHTLVSELETLRRIEIPYKLERYGRQKDLVAAFAKRGKEQERIARDTLFYLENGIKARTGYLETLKRPALIAAKQAKEDRLRRKLGTNPRWKKTLLPSLDAMDASQRRWGELCRRYHALEWSWSSRLLDIARTLVRWGDEREKPSPERLPEYGDSRRAGLEHSLLSPEPIYPAFEEVGVAFLLDEMRRVLGDRDPTVQAVLGKRTPLEVARAAVKGSKLADVNERKRLFKGGKRAVQLSKDPLIALWRKIDGAARDVRKQKEREVDGVRRLHGPRIDEAWALLSGKEGYPDATGTLRIAFGPAKGYTDKGKRIPWCTTFGQMFEKVTGKPPYDLHPRVHEARGRMKLDVPFNFVGTADITGGNSGSPAIDVEGRCVGTAFDGNIHQLGNEFLYSEDRARSVFVHSAGIVEALKSVYGVSELLEELIPPAR